MDLDAIKARWQGVEWSSDEEADAILYTGDDDSSILVSQATEAERATLRLAAHAPADVAALVGECERLRARNAELLKDTARCLHKAAQYDDVVKALQVADGGRYRVDTIESILDFLRRTTGEAE